jgi:hypothetical protein
MRKRVASMLVIGAAVGASVVAAPAAMATSSGGSCVGTLVNSVGLTDIGTGTGTVYGYLNVYWDGSTGQNCVTVTSSSVDWGVQKPMSAGLEECAGDTVASCSTYLYRYSDGSGDGWGPGAGFSYYAGPVNGAGAGHCIDAWGVIDYGGVLSYAEVKGDC